MNELELTLVKVRITKDHSVSGHNNNLVNIKDHILYACKQYGVDDQYCVLFNGLNFVNTYYMTSDMVEDLGPIDIKVKERIVEVEKIIEIERVITLRDVLGQPIKSIEMEGEL